MKFFFDSELIHIILSDAIKREKNPLLEACKSANILINNQPMQVNLSWPALFELLDMGVLFDKFPAFNAQNNLFAMIKSALETSVSAEVLMRLYDQIFVECLTHVKAIPQVNRAFLIDQIQKKRQSLLPHSEGFFSEALSQYENALLNHPYSMHDLTLYLAWERVCVNLAIVFESFQEQKIGQSLNVLKECLLESFQHIFAQGKTVPAFFRMIEALHAYQMREENLQIHSESDWLLLCQSLTSLKPREGLLNLPHIDASITSNQKWDGLNRTADPLQIFTMATVDQIKKDLSFANYMLEKLKIEIPSWSYYLSALEVICLKECEGDLLIDAVFSYKP